MPSLVGSEMCIRDIFFAKCFAGETNRKLVEFNFSKIKEFQNPMHKIETILNYFKTTPGRYVIWIDEIEKQFADETTTDMLGVFLTELNEFQSDVSNVFFIATANNISYFAQRFPELLRPGGRFDRLFFLLPSKDDDVEFIFDIYVKAVSYTHLTLPTICSVQISVVAVSLKKKKIKHIKDGVGQETSDKQR
eukprot:TRINITY_DN31280_c0_g1_i2.p2 TRINITY_DN31280_c0_g1~~TRINITY_DN31280_c0_g1_i2.p2  ORF type:complete len:192 (-),score=42.45 TRINITY_DN31280_c0_g1_i2:39-614(-)